MDKLKIDRAGRITLALDIIENLNIQTSDKLNILGDDESSSIVLKPVDKNERLIPFEAINMDEQGHFYLSPHIIAEMGIGASDIIYFDNKEEFILKPQKHQEDGFLKMKIDHTDRLTRKYINLPDELRDTLSLGKYYIYLDKANHCIVLKGQAETDFYGMSLYTTHRLDELGRVLVPSALRKRLNLKPNSELDYCIDKAKRTIVVVSCERRCTLTEWT